MKPVPDKQITAHLNTKQQKKNPTGARTRSRLLSDRSLLVGLGCLASLGLLSQGLVRTKPKLRQQNKPSPAQQTSSHYLKLLSRPRNPNTAKGRQNPTRNRRQKFRRPSLSMPNRPASRSTPPNHLPANIICPTRADSPARSDGPRATF